MRILRGTLIWLCCTLTAFAQLTGVSADFKFDQDQYLPGEDIQLKLSIMNRSGQEVFLGGEDDWIHISIVNEKGVACESTGQMPAAGKFSLLSGEVGTVTFNPAPYFKIDKLGRYRVSGSFQVPQWHQQVDCRAALFNIGYGAAIPSLANLQFGVPPPAGATNTLPEIRKYSLIKVTFSKEIKLYCRVTDSDNKILRVQQISKMMSFSEPEAQIDRFSNFHVLLQTGARAFTYCVINPDGEFVSRETYLYNETRPKLKMMDNGKIGVEGGQHVASSDDIVSGNPELVSHPAAPKE